MVLHCGATSGDTSVDRLMLPLLAHRLQAVSLRDQEGLVVTLATSQYHLQYLEFCAFGSNAPCCAPETLHSLYHVHLVHNEQTAVFA